MNVRSDVEQRAQAYLKRWGIVEPPVDVTELVRLEGIELVFSRSKGMESGFALSEGFRRVIGVNSLEAPRRQRFTIGHELGHLDMHNERGLTVDQSVRVFKRDEVSSMASDSQEIEANAFAAALLMPQSFLHQIVPEVLKTVSGGRDQLISALAKRFDVSVQAMGYRLINLGMLSP